MNLKAESFKSYLEEKAIKAFTIQELDDQPHSVIFRSQMDIYGNMLPTAVIWDDSIYGLIRVVVAPAALKEDNKEELLELLNNENKKYKAFKYYVDDQGNLILDTCILTKDNVCDGDMVYIMFDVLINNLNDNYKEFMKVIWK